MKNCIIFGGTGFIGSHFANYLLSNNLVDCVYLYDLKPIRPFFKSSDSRIRYIYGDVRQQIINDGLSNDIFLVLNFAAIHREPGHEDIEYFSNKYFGC